MGMGGPLWSPAVAWAPQLLSPRQGSPSMGGHKGPNPTPLLTRPYARDRSLGRFLLRLMCIPADLSALGGWSAILMKK